jgi:hypothetical protein
MSKPSDGARGQPKAQKAAETVADDDRVARGADLELRADLKSGPSLSEDAGWPRKEVRRALPRQAEER